MIWLSRTFAAFSFVPETGVSFRYVLPEQNGVTSHRR
jgi:hypothetical protein